jgi:HEAT repeat protein
MTEVEGDAHALVAALADPKRREAAFAELGALGARARAAVRAGLGDGRWEVRRWCALWLWRFAVADDVPRLVPLLRDARAKVRQAAIVALAQSPAAPDVSDLVPLLIERALEDESLRVRRQAVLLLAWEHPHPDLEGFFAGLLESERDAALHKYAGIGRLRCRERARRAPTGAPSC